VAERCAALAVVARAVDEVRVHIRPGLLHIEADEIGAHQHQGLSIEKLIDPGLGRVHLVTEVRQLLERCRGSPGPELRQVAVEPFEGTLIEVEFRGESPLEG